MKIYFDEAGNSGQNLLDPSQPIFVLASVNFSDDEARKLLAPIETASHEMHFVRLKKYRKQQLQVVEALNNKLITSKRVKIIYYDKRFGLIAHLVDQLIETSFYHKGIDLYKKGLNLTYSNSIYFFGKNVWDKDLNEMFLSDFQKMIREKSKESIEDFYLSAKMLHDSVESYQQKILQPVLDSEEYIESILESIRKYSIDLTLPSITRLADLWHKELDEALDIIHDDSKQVEFWKNLIYFLANMLGTEKVEVGYDYRKMTYPLAIDSVTLQSSKNVLQLQVADLIASSLAYCVKRIHIDKATDDEFANEILKSRIANIKAYPIMPSDKVTPKQLGTEDDNGINPLDYLAAKSLEKGADYDKAFE
ncbi:DUF3800 domain-containing protein [Flavobacterium sp.]|uniref:DUF3800 domain-containing protein n=1 Tax=Flavobacterium sp. TaxID=239 RepID=UPI004033CCC5